MGKMRIAYRCDRTEAGRKAPAPTPGARDYQGPAIDLPEHLACAVRRPGFQIDILVPVEFKQNLVGTHDALHLLDSLLLAAIQIIRQAQHRCQQLDCAFAFHVESLFAAFGTQTI